MNARARSIFLCFLSQISSHDSQISSLIPVSSVVLLSVCNYERPKVNVGLSAEGRAPSQRAAH